MEIVNCDLRLIPCTFHKYVIESIDDNTVDEAHSAYIGTLANTSSVNGMYTPPVFISYHLINISSKSGGFLSGNADTFDSVIKSLCLFRVIGKFIVKVIDNIPTIDQRTTHSFPFIDILKTHITTWYMGVFDTMPIELRIAMKMIFDIMLICKSDTYRKLSWNLYVINESNVYNAQFHINEIHSPSLADALNILGQMIYDVYAEHTRDDIKLKFQKVKKNIDFKNHVL